MLNGNFPEVQSGFPGKILKPAPEGRLFYPADARTY